MVPLEVDHESICLPPRGQGPVFDRQAACCMRVADPVQDKMNLGAGLGVAVREFQTTSGPADYGLFVGRKLFGVIEAKPEGTTLSGYSEQAARYIAEA
jgi:type I restriction enzyme, R subunit